MKMMARILFAAPKSGSGKTMITCGCIELLKRRNLKVASFKCGPDYIDPMFHRRVLGVPSGNLDTYFTDEQMTRYLFWNQAKNVDISVLEGVMGYYDGLGGESEEASTYEIAQTTKTPVILIVDGKGASVSLAAVMKGIVEYRENSRIAGILLNRVSRGYYGRIKEVIEKECKIPVVGYFPELKNLEVPSRHLGLVSPKEMQEFQNWISQIAETMEESVDMEQILTIAESAEPLSEKEEMEGYEKNLFKNLPFQQKKVRIAVARDEAFSFYYEENMELLRKMGAEIVPFSPLQDVALPKEVDGLILGGGYPEIYAKELSKNKTMRESILSACERKLPCMAECGGFLYLQKSLEGKDGISYPMVGVLTGDGYRTEKLCRFGYMQAKSQKAGLCGDAGMFLKGHEFHYWDCTENGDGFVVGKPIATKKGENGEYLVKNPYSCIVYNNHMMAGFPHFYYYSNPKMIEEFLEQCAIYQVGRETKEHWDQIAKPIDSLGLLEDNIVKINRIARNSSPQNIEKRALLVLSGDHGVVAEGVTQTGQEVTKIVSENFAKGCSTVNYMAKVAKVDVFVIDVGMNTDSYPEKNLIKGAIVDRKIGRGTKNLAREAAMSYSDCQKAISVGMQLVKDLKEKGYRMVATGEMGIGNTTPTSALAAILLKKTAEEVTGVGAGLSQEGLQRKRKVINQAIQRVEEKGLEDPVAILAEVGGFEIAAMAGVFLGGKQYQIPIVMDGAISCVAALTATQIDARVTEYLLASHQSDEATGKLALEEMGLQPIIHGKMCLGEGTGAMTLFPILDMAMEVYKNMGSFQDYEIEAYERFEEER